MVGKFKKGMKYIFEEDYRFIIDANRGKYDELPDEEYVKRFYKATFGKELNLDNPQTFNEKIQWLKLYDRKPIYTKMVDKYEAKKYVASIIGEEYIIPTYGVWDHFDEIDFNKLPSQFVLKSTHDCGGLVIVRDKSKMDKEAARAKLEKCLNRNYYLTRREWPYKDVKPRIIAEKYMEDSSSPDLPVYKIFNFMGKPELIQAIQNDKTSHETIDYFNTEWEKLELRQNFPNSEIPLKRPEKLKEMLEIAKTLCKDFSFIRTDLYSINGEIFFSEFTFYSDSGFASFTPEEWDKNLGDLIKLPETVGGGTQ